MVDRGALTDVGREAEALRRPDAAEVVGDGSDARGTTVKDVRYMPSNEFCSVLHVWARHGDQTAADRDRLGDPERGRGGRAGGRRRYALKGAGDKAHLRMSSARCRREGATDFGAAGSTDHQRRTNDRFEGGRPMCIFMTGRLLSLGQVFLDFVGKGRRAKARRQLRFRQSRDSP